MKATTTRGFTLIEMLVVIAILGILMAMMVPAAGLIVRRATLSRTRGDARMVVSTMGKYHAEYNRWPRSYVDEQKDMTDANWVQTMAPDPNLNATVPDNFKRILFFEAGGGAVAPAIKPDGKPHPHPGSFADPWGNPFQFKLDVAGAGEMANPNEDVGGVIRGKALAWSAGPDGDYDTWDDNETSWE